MAKSLKEQKIEMKNDWEKCFEKKIEDKLTEKGLKKFWDENTSLEEAMLTHAAVDDFVEHLMGSLAGAIIIGVGGCQDEEEANDDAETEQFQVFRSKDNFFYENVFDSVESAKEFIRGLAMSTMYTVDDFKIVKVYD